ncbi:hypothetical protein KDL01_22820 [Actinospica durhamensis]|uniref:Transcriptional regulator n=1 Tax=Actinospica durhamensis TaxID=1508375 RepID=A0A941ITL7_9ACTN|nr:hypothetical protein [Actinospica durhamensis]MBR7836128.1 hypothetical protein [Actinospica durhamensis]
MRTANSSLQQLLGEANWTQDLLARQVNALAREVGLTIRLDRRTVSHWLAGRKPRAPLPDLIAEALSRRLGRPLTAERVGLSDPQEERFGRDRDLDPLETLRQLSKLTEAGRESELGGAYCLGELAVPGWPAGLPPRPVARPATGARLEPVHVSAAEAMAALFADADAVFGGGHARAALGRYLAYDIAPRLRAPGARRIRDRMLAVATELTHLCALMCFDDEQHALAQRYFAAALALAVENENPAEYAAILRSMSAQAHALGHPVPALSLARAAIESAEGRVLSDHQRAGLHGQFAVAAAAHGDGPAALAALERADVLLRTGRIPRGAAVAAYHPAAHAHHAAAVHTLLGDLPAGIKMLSESIRRRPAHERRTRAMAHALLAGMHLDQGHLDESVAACHAFIDAYPDLRSARAHTALRTLQARLRPHSAHHSARQLLARAAAISRPARPHAVI